MSNTKKYLKSSDIFINYNKFNSRAASVLNKVSSRGDSEESNSLRYIFKNFDKSK